MIRLKEINQTRETVSFKNQDINIGLDVHKKNWSASIYLNDRIVKTFHQKSKGSILLTHLKRIISKATTELVMTQAFVDFRCSVS